MQKFFNTAGPCNPEEHYMLPAQERCRGIHGLIEQKQYFVIHAARQSGKTTLLLDLVQELNASGNYYALYCSLESVQKIDTPEKGIPAIVRTLAGNILLHPLLEKFSFAENADYEDFNNVLKLSLIFFCKKIDKPLVIMFDEADCLSDGTLICFLRQLRDGYTTRAMIPFVHSVGLIGMRNIRDYKGKIREDRESLGSASPFNIVSEAFTLRNFTQEETDRLYAQHTEETGQVFSPESSERLYHYTQGQPWLVNAAAKEIVAKILKSDFSQTVVPEHAEQAVRNIILRRDTHIDSLLERLKEERVRKVLEPVITGEESRFHPLDDDFQYVLDLGLLRNDRGRFEPANPVYGEVILRTLSLSARHSMNEKGYPHPPVYISEGKLDMIRLLSDFQEFWRENSEIWEERFQYKEAAPHLVLTAFLQRVVNAGGQITREMASGRGRLDMCVHYGDRRYPAELKIRYGPGTCDEGKIQLSDYLDKMGCAEGWLIVFDRRKTVSWEEKIFRKTEQYNKKQIHMIGC